MTDRLVRVGDVAVHVTGSGPGIVLLHANGGDHRDFAAIVPSLARTRTVYAVDLPDHGGSGSMSDVTARRLAELVPDVLEGLDCGPVALLGNSVGGFAALRTAIERPELVSQLVLVNPGGFTPRTPLMFATCGLFGNERVAPIVMRQLPKLYLRVATKEVAAARKRASLASQSPAQVRTFASIWRSFTEPCHDGRRGADLLAVPTLLVWGKKDPVLPWWIDGKRAAKTLTGASIVTMNCGHQAFLEMPREFSEILEDFLSGADPELS